MSSRSSIYVLVGAVASCFLLLLCVGLIGGSYYFLNNRAVPISALPISLLSAPTSLNQIAFVGNDFNIYVTDPVAGTTTALTKDGGTDHAYNFPTWAPDSQRLAFVGYTYEGGSPKEGALYTVAPTGEKLTPVYTTPENFPFYLYWSPDSQVISFLANNDSQEIALNIAHADQANSMKEVDSGAPFYWAWAPDGSKMFTHVGGTRADNDDARLAVVSSNAPDTQHSLEALPGQFQAPQWSQTGKILYSTQKGTEQAIDLSDVQGQNQQELATYSGRASFSLSHDGEKVAYLLTDANVRLPHFGLLRVVDANGANATVISQDPALAFLWSPDSSKLAYLTVTVGANQSNYHWQAAPSIASTTPEKFPGALHSEQGDDTTVQLHWRVWDRATNTSRTVSTFVPTLSFLNIIPYFDQYANSSTFWSPDSKSLVYTNRETQTSGTVYIADAVGDNSPRKVGEGVLAFWSWK